VDPRRVTDAKAARAVLLRADLNVLFIGIAGFRLIGVGDSFGVLPINGEGRPRFSKKWQEAWKRALKTRELADLPKTH
jgi:hypothetical protein